MCPCGSSQEFEKCCGPYISGAAYPETCEQLMRSRYTAYARGEIGYLKSTLANESQSDFDFAATKQWAAKSKWKKLEIVSTEAGGVTDKKGKVEFVATYSQDGQGIEHHEVSTFRKDDQGHWKFIDGESHTHEEGQGHHHHHHAKPETFVREQPKVGRNDPCPCGSGKKYKKCHGQAA